MLFRSVHHSFLSGLLMHTANMMAMADFLSGQYASVIDRSLLLTGTLLHDFAKEIEFRFSDLGIVTDYSVVGMVFESPERCVVVKSDVDGIMQHFAFSWQMHGGEFAKAEDVADSSVVFNKSLNGWLTGLSKEQREHAVDALFSVLEASGAGSISAIVAAGPKVIPEMLGTYVGLSSADRHNINQALVILLQAALARNPKVQRK